MLNAVDISPNFSPEALQLLANTLQAAGKQNQALATQFHLSQVLIRLPQITPLLTKLGRTDLTLSQSHSGNGKSVIPGMKINKPGVVKFSPDLKKIIYLAYAESLILNSPLVEPVYFLVPLNDYLNEPLIAKDIRQTILNSSTMSPAPRSFNEVGTLKNFAENLTQKAASGKIDAVIGRDKEIEQLIRILARRTKSNAILVGDPGVGKTAIVEGLALKISQNQVPDLLKGIQIYALNLTTMLAGTSYQGELETRLQALIKEVKRSGNIIIFIDEIHMIMGAGSAAGAMTAANILKPALARGDLNIIGATTQDEYRQYIEKDPALERRFEPVKVDEPSREATILILKAVAAKLTKHHGVTIDDAVIEASVDLSTRYVQDRFLPDKAIDVLDEATSGAKVAGKAAITIEDLKTVLSQRTGIPISSLGQEESLKLMNLETQLETQIIGQNQAVKAISDVIKRSRAGLKDPNRPIGSFLLLGPTGVGKTELAKALARTVYQSEKAMIRLDMSEFTEAHTADKLIGAPPGYVGYEEGGQLTNPVRHHPYSLILMDELEKAHPKVFDIFLQVLEDGRLTDSQGHLTDFKNTIIIMTSNIDVSEFLQGDSLTGGPILKGPTLKKGDSLTGGPRKSRAGTAKPEGVSLMDSETAQPDRTALMKALSSYLRPEFLNRIDDIIVMNKLGLKEIKAIAKLQLNQVINRLKQKNITLTIPEAALDKLASLGNVAEFGARPLRRLIQEKIEEPLAELIIAYKLKSGDTINWTEDKLK